MSATKDNIQATSDIIIFHIVLFIVYRHFGGVIPRAAQGLLQAGWMAYVECLELNMGRFLQGKYVTWYTLCSGLLILSLILTSAPPFPNVLVDFHAFATIPEVLAEV